MIKTKTKPNRKNKRRSTKRETTRFALHHPSPQASLGAVGFPLKLRTTLKYVDTVSLTLGAGSVSTRQFSCNGLFDPDITSTGHQPCYFDNLTAIYDHYTVFSSRVKFTLLSLTGTGINASLYVDDDTTTTTFAAQSAEQGTGVSLMQVLTTPAKSLTMTWDAKQYFGGDIFDNDNLQGTASANPTEQSYFTLTVTDLTGIAWSYYLLVELEYDAIWDELKTQPLN
jgi:hypothetical protein